MKTSKRSAGKLPTIGVVFVSVNEVLDMLNANAVDFEVFAEQALRDTLREVHHAKCPPFPWTDATLYKVVGWESEFLDELIDMGIHAPGRDAAGQRVWNVPDVYDLFCRMGKWAKALGSIDYWTPSVSRG